MRNFYMCAAGVLALASIAGSAGAQVYYPGVNEASNAGISSPSREAPRVMQSFLDSSFLIDVTAPTTITGLSFRLPGSANTTYPAVDLNFGQYDITLARPSAAAAAANALTSNTFADNMRDPVLVRSGALTIPANTFTDNNTGPGVSAVGTEPAEFSFVIPFTTPYVLTPGEDLVVLLRHGGHGNADQVSVPWYNFDSFTYTSGGRVATGDPNAASGSLLPDTVLKYALVVPEPSGIALLALCGIAALRRGRSA